MSSSAPLVSIITPSFNQGRWIGRTLDSIAGQTYPHVEHLVLDGGSTDETVEILKAAPGIRWLSEKDRGQADAINKGLRMARGEIVAYLNSDDLLFPDAVEKVVRAFERDPRIDFLYGDGDVIDEEDRLSWVWLSRPEDWRLLHGYHFLWNDFTNYIIQQSTFWRPRLHQRIGLFDETFHYALDVEFWLRVGASGARMVHVPEKLGRFRMIQGTKSLSSPTVFWADHLELFRRHRGGTEMQPFVEQYLFEEMAKTGCDAGDALHRYEKIVDGRWGGLPAREREELREIGRQAVGAALVLLADDAFAKGDRDRGRQALYEAVKLGTSGFLRPRALQLLTHAVPGGRKLFERLVKAYRSRRYLYRYRSAT